LGITQRTLKEIEEVVILPSAETIIKSNSIDSIIEKIKLKMKIQNFSAYEINYAIQKIKVEKDYSDISKFISIIYNNTNTVSDYLGNTVFINYDKPALKEAAFDLGKNIYKDYQKAHEEKRFCVEPDKLYIKWNEY